MYNSNGNPTLFKGIYKLLFTNGNDQNIQFQFNITQNKRLNPIKYQSLH